MQQILCLKVKFQTKKYRFFFFMYICTKKKICEEEITCMCLRNEATDEGDGKKTEEK